MHIQTFCTSWPYYCSYVANYNLNMSITAMYGSLVGSIINKLSLGKNKCASINDYGCRYPVNECFQKWVASPLRGQHTEIEIC